MPPRPAGSGRGPIPRTRTGARRRRPTVEFLEDRILRSDLPAGLTARRQEIVELRGAVAEVADVRPATARIGSARIVATPAARDLPVTAAPPKLAAAAFSVFVSQMGFETPARTLPLEESPIVPTADEALGMHSTLDQAQAVAARGPILIRGSIGPGELPDYYRLAMESGPLRIGFHANDPALRLADRLSIYDESGRLVGDWTLPADAEGMTVELTGTDDERGHEIYVGVGSVQGNEVDGRVESYQLLIEPAARLATPLELPAGVPYEPKVPVEPDHSSFSESTTPSAMASPETPPAELALSLIVPMGLLSNGDLGPLPLLAAAPLGGALSQDTTLSVDLAERSQIDLALSESPVDSPALLVDAEPLSSDLLARVSQEGGLPLLASTRARSRWCEAPVLTEGNDLGEVSPLPGETLADARDQTARPSVGRRAIFPLSLGMLATLATTFQLGDGGGNGRRREVGRALPRWLRRWLRSREA